MLTTLKQEAVDSNKLWKAVGKPRHGQIFDRRQLCRARYRKALSDRDKRSTMTYTNELHEALIIKDGPTFLKCWRSKFKLHKNVKRLKVVLMMNLLLEILPNIFQKERKLFRLSTH